MVLQFSKNKFSHKNEFFHSSGNAHEKCGSIKWQLHYGLFRGSNLNSGWEKYNIWLVNQWIPSCCAFVVSLHVLGYVRVDMMIILCINCMCLTMYHFLLSCVLVNIYSYLYVFILHGYVLHDYLVSTWCMTCLSMWDIHLSPYLQLPSLGQYFFP